jgi:2-hydroxymuconate-semialdehyde hydrolase
MNDVKDPELGRQIEAGGITTNYHDVGSGDPVLMIHGSGAGVSAWANWRLNIPILAESRRVIAPDMVGFGYTQRPEGAVYGRELWLRHAIGLLDALDLDRVDIVGNSFGGGLALAMAVHYPERVRRLVLMGSVGIEFPLTPGLDAAWGYEPSMEAMRHLLSLFAYDQSRITEDLVRMRYEASIRPGFQETFGRMFPAPRQQGITALAVPEEQIAAMSHPTLVLHGRDDLIIPPENAVRLFNLLPAAQLHMFGKCGHWTQIEHAASFNRLVNDFLSEAD